MKEYYDCVYNGISGSLRIPNNHTSMTIEGNFTGYGLFYENSDFNAINVKLIRIVHDIEKQILSVEDSFDYESYKNNLCESHKNLLVENYGIKI